MPISHIPQKTHKRRRGRRLVLLKAKRLLEKQGCKGIEVEAPVGPCVTAFGDEEGVVQTFVGEGFVESLGILEQEVAIATCKPIKFVSALLQGTELLQAFF